MEENKRIVEINGVKMEVDLRHAQIVHENIKVGDRVKVLKHDSNETKVFPGVVVGFEDFQELPTVVVAYLKNDWNGTTLEFLYFNDKTEKMEMIPDQDGYHLFDKGDILNKMDREIETKEREIAAIQQKKKYFTQRFNAYFGEETTKV